MLIPNSCLDFWNSDQFFATSGRNSQSCLFCQKIDTHGISRMLIFIPKLVFWISNPKSIFAEIWTKINKVVRFVWKLAHKVSRECRFLFQNQFSDIRNLSLENADFYSDISFLKFQTKSFFLANLSRKSQTPYFLWNLKHRVSWGCDCKDTEKSLKAKIEMNNYIKCLLLLYFYRN